MMVKITVLQLAQVLPKKLEKSKHEKARKLMQSHLIYIYLESYIDLEKKEADILCFSKRKAFGKVKIEYISEMAQSILKQYDVPKVDLHYYPSYAAFVTVGAVGCPSFKIKSSIIRPAIVSTGSEIPSIMVNVYPLAYDVKTEVETFFNVTNNALRNFGFDATSTFNNDLEAGQIMIITEVEE